MIQHVQQKASAAMQQATLLERTGADHARRRKKWAILPKTLPVKHRRRKRNLRMDLTEREGSSASRLQPVMLNDAVPTPLISSIYLQAQN
eukprot:7411679-Pyramimonas_sp.AAC.1